MRADFFMAGTLVNRLTRNVELTEGNGVKKKRIFPTHSATTKLSAVLREFERHDSFAEGRSSGQTGPNPSYIQTYV